MTVGLLSIELYLPMSQSLKDKRMVLRRLKDRLTAMNIAVAEVAHQDVWQRAGLGIVTVASADKVAEETLNGALREIERLEPGLVTQSQIEYLHLKHMAQGSRPDRVGEQVRQALSEMLLREVRDPGIGFITLSRVKVSPDLQLVRVYYTQIGDDRAKKETVKALERATPFLRRQLADAVRLRRVPELRFHFDEGVEHQARIEQILLDLQKEREGRETETGKDGESSMDGENTMDDGPSKDDDE